MNAYVGQVVFATFRDGGVAVGEVTRIDRSGMVEVNVTDPPVDTPKGWYAFTADRVAPAMPCEACNGTGAADATFNIGPPCFYCAGRGWSEVM